MTRAEISRAVERVEAIRAAVRAGGSFDDARAALAVLRRELGGPLFDAALTLADRRADDNLTQPREH
ncbi:MAG TPA: hypothetical protein VHZ75_09105 [Solirubrobacteraceae bacterium]|jgi:hypothetical protein|nr:hypothetical protein [Solirubrobacteraceae bacterium]